MTSSTMRKQLVLQQQAIREELERKTQEFLARGGKVYVADVTEHKTEDLTGNERRKMLTTRGFFCD